MCGLNVRKNTIIHWLPWSYLGYRLRSKPPNGSNLKTSGILLGNDGLQCLKENLTEGGIPNGAHPHFTFKSECSPYGNVGEDGSIGWIGVKANPNIWLVGICRCRKVEQPLSTLTSTWHTSHPVSHHGGHKENEEINRYKQDETNVIWFVIISKTTSMKNDEIDTIRLYIQFLQTRVDYYINIIWSCDQRNRSFYSFLPNCGMSYTGI